MTTIATVAPTELIRSTWGNSVAVELNTAVLKRDGSLAMTGDLITNGVWSANANAAMPRSYIDSVASGKLNNSGVNFLTGTLWVTSADNYCLRLKSVGESPTIDFFNNATTVQFGYIGYSASNAILQFNPGGQVQITPTFARLYSSTGKVTLQANSGVIEFNSNGTVVGEVQGGQFLWGKTVYDAVTPGIEMLDIGSFRSIMNNTSNCNLFIRRDGGATASGNDFQQYLTNVPGVGLGIAGAVRITGGGSGVAFLTSSDYRIKNDLGPVVDALGQCLALVPRRLEMKQDPGHEFVGFFAHEVQTVAPYAVSGDKDEVYTVEEADAFAGIDPGDPKIQQLDVSKIVPLLTAGLQELAERVTALEDT